MSGAMCQNFPKCMEATNDATIPKCHKPDCPGNRTWLHVLPKANPSLTPASDIDPTASDDPNFNWGGDR